MASERLPILSIGVLALWLFMSPAGVEARETGVMKLVGGLHCAVGPVANLEVPAELACELRLMAPAPARLGLAGRMTGSGLPLLAPGQITLFWTVYAPTLHLDPVAVEGTYDVGSRHGFVIAEQSDRVLVGGMNDSVVLELVAPRINPISQDTRLVLDR